MANFIKAALDKVLTEVHPCASVTYETPPAVVKYMEMQSALGIQGGKKEGKVMAKEIQLNQGIITIVDDDDFEYLNQWKWYLLKSHTNYYAIRTSKPENKLIQLHRVVIKAKEGEFVDHINGNKLDNRKINLRICTKAQNSQNRKMSKFNKSGFNGVSWCIKNKKWVAQISCENKKIHIGYYIELKDAARAYNQAAQKYHGEFAKLNILD